MVERGFLRVFLVFFFFFSSYLLTAMIVVEGEKFACEKCIRGHRSSRCKHIGRPLVLVRSRGRPLEPSDTRLAIEARANCRCGHLGAAKCVCEQADSVIVLQASSKQMYSVKTESLTLLEPVKSIKCEGTQDANNAGARTGDTTNATEPASAKSSGCHNGSGTAGGAATGAGTSFDMFISEPCYVPGDCQCDPDNCLYMCIEHHFKDLLKQQDQTFKPLGSVQILNDMDLTSECSCPDDMCFCYNCSTHGIIEGVKVGTSAHVDKLLSDLTTLENQLASSTQQQKTCMNSNNILKLVNPELAPLGTSLLQRSSDDDDDGELGPAEPGARPNLQSSCCGGTKRVKQEHEEDAVTKKTSCCSYKKQKTSTPSSSGSSL